MGADPEPLRHPERSAPLADLGEALRAFDPAKRSLGELLAGHTEAARLLTDALLNAAELDAPADSDAGSTPDDGPTIGSYRIVRELGRGGQAVVFEATDLRLGRRVALKVLRADVFRSRVTESRFRAEAMTTSRLDHPGICPIYEIDTDGDQLFLAMRYVEGATLAAHIQVARERAVAGQPFRLELPTRDDGLPEPGGRRPRPWLGALRLLESAARALDAAHRAGVTHRDFKPGNLMIQQGGAAVVLDFGMAGDDERDGATLTRSGEVFGTPAYMAPEQCRDSRFADPRSDVFALGATLYEALTGERAFHGPTPEAVIRRILTGRVPDPRRVSPGLPRELAVIMGKALDPDPDRRYQTAAEFADDLQRFCEARPILAEPPSVLLVARRWVQRNPWLTALLLVTAIGIGVSSWMFADAWSRGREVDHLTVAQSLADLRAEYGALLPIQDNVVRAREWLDRADALIARRVELQSEIGRLRATALPPDAAELARAQSNHPAALELERLRGIERSLAAGLGTPEALAGQRAASARRAARQRELQADLDALRTWAFADPERQRVHDAVTRSLTDLSAFAAATGLRATVARELTALASSADVTARDVGAMAASLSANEKVSEPWRAAVESIAKLPAYGGLELRPQPGLEPLRYNETSRLWEFVHVRSGAAPEIRADGRLAIDERSGIVLVLLPGGRITVGTQDEDPNAPNYLKNPRPIDRFLLTVPIDPFFLAAHETTQAQWQRLGGGNPSALPAGTTSGRREITAAHPVENIDWSEAVDLLSRSGLTLPTDLQWEYAARASRLPYEGSAAADAWLDHENLWDISAVEAGLNGTASPRSQDDGWPHHAAVASFRPNALGIYDILGNVMEWCLDTETRPTRDLVRPGDGLWLSPASEKHMLRGASFVNGPTEGNDLPSLRMPYLDRGMWGGVRAARAVER